jgi:hypothetical protein
MQVKLAVSHMKNHESAGCLTLSHFVACAGRTVLRSCGHMHEKKEKKERPALETDVGLCTGNMPAKSSGNFY